MSEPLQLSQRAIGFRERQDGAVLKRETVGQWVGQEVVERVPAARLPGWGAERVGGVTTGVHGASLLSNAHPNRGADVTLQV